jgi:predicted anti-sigma-YlaC factor YlaD
MRCDTYRDAISARADGEDPGVDAATLEEHGRSCAACHGWAAAVADLDLRVAQARPGPAPDLVADVLLAVGREERADDARWDLRLPIAVLAVFQIALALPDLLTSGEGAGVHATREVGSFSLAVAVGLLVVAWRPHRAAALAPVLATVTACLLVTAAVDVARGGSDLGAEIGHLNELVGTVFVVALARTAHSRQRLAFG